MVRTVARLLTLFCVLAAAFVGRASAVKAATPQERQLALETLCVMLISEYADGSREFGAGFIVAQDGAKLYVATAAHVVRRDGRPAQRVRAYALWNNPNRALGVEIPVTVERVDMDLDVAALSLLIEGASAPPADRISFTASGDPRRALPGNAVRAVGAPDGRGWSTCVTPDFIETIDARDVVVQTTCLEPGHSGGVLVDAQWRILGLVRDYTPPIGGALRIDVVAARFRDWSLPFGLTETTDRSDGRFVQIATGERVACGLTVDQAIYCWGAQYDVYNLGRGIAGQTIAPFGLAVADPRRFKAIAGEKNHFCALTLGGVPVCWGDNSFSQVSPRPMGLTTGQAYQVAAPRTVPGVGPFSALFLGPRHSCGLTEDGEAQCWGGVELSPPDWRQPRNDPLKPLKERRWKQLALGEDEWCGIDRAGALFCWPADVEASWWESINQVPFDAAAAAPPAFSPDSEAALPGVAAAVKPPEVKAPKVKPPPKAKPKPPEKPRFRRLFPNETFNMVSLPVESGSRYGEGCALDTAGKIVCWGGDFRMLDRFQPLPKSRRWNVARTFTAVQRSPDVCGITTEQTLVCDRAAPPGGTIEPTFVGEDRAAQISYNRMYCLRTIDQKVYCDEATIDFAPDEEILTALCTADDYGIPPRSFYQYIRIPPLSSTTYGNGYIADAVVPRYEPQWKTDHERLIATVLAWSKALHTCRASIDDPAIARIEAAIAAEDAITSAIAAWSTKADWDEKAKAFVEVPPPPPPASYFRRIERALAEYKRLTQAVRGPEAVPVVVRRNPAAAPDPRDTPAPVISDDLR